MSESKKTRGKIPVENANTSNEKGISITISIQFSYYLETVVGPFFSMKSVSSHHTDCSEICGTDRESIIVWSCIHLTFLPSWFIGWQYMTQICKNSQAKKSLARP